MRHPVASVVPSVLQECVFKHFSKAEKSGQVHLTARCWWEGGSVSELVRSAGEGLGPDVDDVHDATGDHQTRGSKSIPCSVWPENRCARGVEFGVPGTTDPGMPTCNTCWDHPGKRCGHAFPSDVKRTTRCYTTPGCGHGPGLRKGPPPHHAPSAFSRLVCGVLLGQTLGTQGVWAPPHETWREMNHSGSRGKKEPGPACCSRRC